MARVPSDTEILEAVEVYARRRGVSARLADPGAAALTWQFLLDFRIVRSVEERGERPMREPGSRREELAGRPTYTSIESYRVAPPDDPERHDAWRLVRRGSLGEERCEKCKGGTNSCGACGGRGVRDCPRFVDCPVCQGGPDACWECEGTGRRRAGRPAHPYAAAPSAHRVLCTRCRTSQVACPKCGGRRQLDCTTCKKTGSVQCGTCEGTKRVIHQECEGTGRFTVWTEGYINQSPRREKERRLGRLDLRRTTGNAGRWHETVLRGAADELPDDLDEADRTLIDPLLAPRKDEVARRATLRRLPLAHVRVHADPHRDYYAFPSHTGIEVTSRPTKERVRNVAAIAAASLVLVALFAALGMAVLR